MSEVAINPFPLVGRWALVLFTALVIQVGIMPSFTVLGVIIDIMLPLAICAGLSGGVQRGAIVGFWAGLLFDLLRPGPVGVSALAYRLVAAAAGLLQVSVLASSRSISTGIVAVAGSLGVLFFAICASLFGSDSLSQHDLWRVVLVMGLTSGVLSRPALLVTGWAEGPDGRSNAG